MLIFNSVSVPVILLTSIVVAAVLIYLPYTVVAYSRLTASSGYDAANPRSTFDELPAYAKRANWAHQNSFESFSIFAAAVLMAYVTEQTSPTVAYAVVAYLVARFLYSIAYILAIPVGRSLMFGIGNIGIIILFVTSIRSIM
ncbi:MAG: MAPEG family protein [Leptolyngbyaceae bacterium]|nr:MAPEG family protein [Leptolyngbyaceae bacterium]